MGIPLEDKIFRAVAVEVQLILQSPGVLGVREFRATRGNKLELAEFSLADLEPGDTKQFAHFGIIGLTHGTEEV